MLILGIETSCDDTSIAVLRAKNDKNLDNIEVISNIVSSQIKIHNEYGGVVPNLAAREHEKNLPLVLEEALELASTNHGNPISLEDIDLIAVTSGPGLIMSLVQGVNFAKALSQKHNKPIIGVNHMEGHIYSNCLEDNKKIEFPALCLTVSGGHTELVLMKGHGEYKLLGRTKDDASGEAFDKIARLIGLEYPGGPAISREAKLHIPEQESYTLPRPMMYTKDLDFSFSGLKTSVYYLVRDLKKKAELTPAQVSAISHEAQEAIVDVLIHKTKKAVELHNPKSILLSGGVSANKLLREKFQALRSTLYVSVPSMKYTTDNAAMIAMAGYYNVKNITDLSSLTPENVKANANWELV